MSHDDHGHDHRHGDANQRRLAWTLALVATYMAAELVGGLLSNSLALLADAGHMLSDSAALALALFAGWIARRPPSPRTTYGYYRVEILAALANGATLVAIGILIFVEAYRRFSAPPDVRADLMLGVAMGGLAVNVAALAILHGGRRANLNLRGAWLHVLADTLGSVQAIAAALLIRAFGWRWADPLASVLIGALIIASSWSLLREAVAVLMEAVPGNLDLDQVRGEILSVPGVESVHDLHVWSIGSNFVALSAHVQVRNGDLGIVWQVRRRLSERFRIEHSTIQVEHDEPPKALAVGRNPCP
ncbi:MAG: cation diffusion facilitator family transporter [Acidobacteriota bacterium]